MNSTVPKILVLHTTYYYAQSAPRHLLIINKQIFEQKKKNLTSALLCLTSAMHKSSKSSI
jgi:hypothetical protein